MVVVTRALIMLLVLIVAPLLVVFGSSLGDRPKEMALDAWARLTDTSTAATRKEPDDTNNVAPRFLDAIVSDAPVPKTPIHDSPVQDRPAPSGKKPVALANFEEPVRRLPVHQSAAEAQHQPPAVDRYTTIKQRLRDLGAVYYRLDQLGGPGGEYLFHCEFEDADEPFTATDADLLQSMENVLEQVESWQNFKNIMPYSGFRR